MWLLISGFCIRIQIRMDPHLFELPDSDLHSKCGSGFRRAKMTQKTKKVTKFHVLKSLEAEGFSCSWGILYEGLGISKLQFLINKNVQL
jgi:hypothetical protein